MVILHHFPFSGPSRGALLACRQVGVDVSIKIVDLFNKAQFSPEFVKLNPQHTVPTLQDGDFVLWDGHAIAAYLVNSYGSDSLYPKDPKSRAVVDHRLYFDIGVLYTRIRDICFPVLFKGETEVTAEKLRALDEVFSWVEQFLMKHAWVAGHNLTIADTAFLASISSIKEVGYNICKYPNISDWFRRCEKDIKGFSENLEGAVLFGEAVRSKLKPNQFN